MWGSLTKLANKALAALPSKEEILAEVKALGDLDKLKETPCLLYTSPSPRDRG